MYLINGQLRDDLTLETALALLQPCLPQLLAYPPSHQTVLDCAERFAQRLMSADHDLTLDDDQRQGLIAFCQRSTLAAKLERELGTQPDSLRRFDYTQPHFERWLPLGLIVHITPGNAELLGFCATLEGLLAGNVNWLRPSSSDNGLSARLLATFLESDPSDHLSPYLAVIPAATHEIASLCAQANGVSAWGGETALKAIAQQIPSGCRWIDWGHKISFAYLSPDSASPQALDALVDEVCRLDQQACSSPQWVLVDSDTPAVLQQVGEQLAEAFNRRAHHWPALTPTAQEASEITTRVALARLDQSFAGTTGQVWGAAQWRIVWEHHRTLDASPLFRTLLLRPVPRSLIAETLLPWRCLLQSCALICDPSQTAPLAEALLHAGVTRIAPPRSIHDGYAGEPHDGIYALSRMSRRVSVTVAPGVLSHHATLDSPTAVLPPHGPVMDKAALLRQPVSPAARLFFRSGGSSGTPVLAGYSYGDFNRQMRAAADGLFSLGLDPRQDRAMNLFYGSNLYGGLMSFSRILEWMDVVQLPMGGPTDDDFSEIAQLIVDQRINTLVGMPNTLQRLFLSEQPRLRAYGGIKKVFMGGEHAGESSRELMKRCGVTTVRSALYGSVDAGPLGHACPASPDGIFHLLGDIQHLEILGFDNDAPAGPEVVGRLIFTSHAREGQVVNRYDVGDSGRWVTGDCGCGLRTPRFELLRRHGKLLRVASYFLSTDDLAQLAGCDVQMVLDYDANGSECLLVRTDGDAEAVRQRLMSNPNISIAVNSSLLQLTVHSVPKSLFERHPHSGKSPLIIDLRKPHLVS
ncbi:acyl-CoA reductase [Pseudomonas purpurea]|uniref:acyl-CoA reductase n=1 Tax=Pseudomonas purpurea TaxID=3136737 RepID=UPI003265E0EE